jgi:FAD/FMN-containing dehydrogenase
VTRQGIAELGARVRGTVRTDLGFGYGPVFQAGVRHAPEVVVEAAIAGDVAEAVRFAAEAGLPVSVQASGHGATAAAEGVLVLTGRLDEVRIDAEARTARVGAGARWGAVVEAAARHGLAPLSGSAPGVAAAGYALGGGLGLLGRTFGWAADRVSAVDLVGADGRARTVTAGSEPDVFWGVRGGRGALGIATGLVVGLVPVARLYGGGLFFDTDLIPAVLRAYRDVAAGAPEELTTSVGLVPIPDLPVVPEPLRGRHVAHVRVAYTGEDGERLVAPLRAVGPALIDTLRELPFAESASIYQDPTQPHAYTGDNALLRDVTDADLDTVVELAGPGAPVPCVVELRGLGGALGREAEVPNAVGHREAGWLLRVLSPFGDDLADVRAAHDRLLGAVDSMGRALNFVYGPRDPREYLASAYEKGDLARLAALAADHDRNGVLAAARDLLAAAG